jgi:voltage-gated potassium channel
VILSDTSRGRGERDADARTILAALTVEKLSPQVYTCVELNRREYAPHLELGGVNSFVVGGEHSAFLLAQAAVNKAFFGVFTELLRFETGNRFCRSKVPDRWKGKTFFDAMVEMKEKHDAILVAIEDAAGHVIVNPREYTFVGGEDAIVIAARDVPLG